MKVIALAGQRGAGTALTLEMLRALCGNELRLCAADAAECCRADLCRRAGAFERAGYALQLRELREDEASPAAFDSSIVQLREPSLRALAAYGADLDGRPHAIERLEAFLSAQAFRTVLFHRRWSAEPRVHWLRYEALLTAPRETLGGLLPVLNLVPDDAGLARAEEAARSAPDRAVETEQALVSSPYFIAEAFAEYATLLADAVDYLGYPLWTEGKAAAGRVNALFRARQAQAQADWARVQALLAPLLASAPVDPEIRLMLAEALLQSGREIEGRRAVEAALRVKPDFAQAYLLLAAHDFKIGLTSEARAMLSAAMSQKGARETVRRFLIDTGADAQFLRELPDDTRFPLGRDAVIAGFRWILGRTPENEDVIDAHRVLHSDYDLRSALLRCDEFQAFFRRLEEGVRPDAGGAPPSRDQVLAALFWVLDRQPASREEVESLLKLPSTGQMRLQLMETEEFRTALAQISA